MPEALNGFALHFPRYGLLLICHGIVCCLSVTVWFADYLSRSGLLFICDDRVLLFIISVTIWFAVHLSQSGLSLIYHDLVCCSFVTIWFVVHFVTIWFIVHLSRSGLLFVESLSARVMAIWTLEWIRLCDMIIHCRPVHYILIPGQFIVFILGQFIMF